MYGALWRILPGPKWLKAFWCLLLAALAVVLLFGWVFPWVAELTELGDSATMAAGVTLSAEPSTTAIAVPAIAS